MPTQRRRATTDSARAASGEVARRESEQGTIGDMIKQYETSFAEVVPAHIRPGTFVRLAQGLLRRDAKLREAALANPGSLLAALLDCARLGHEPGTDQYALVPFNETQDDGSVMPVIVGIEQYQGEIERMYRAGAVESVHAEVVREHDHWFYDRRNMVVPDHRPPDFASDEERGAMVGVYAFARLRDGGTSRVVVMGRAEVMKHKAAARGSRSAKSPWNGPFEHSMWLKTAIHELEKWVPTSAEYRRVTLEAAARAAAVAEPARPAPARPTVIDAGTGEIVERPGWQRTGHGTWRRDVPPAEPVERPAPTADEPEDDGGAAEPDSMPEDA